MLGGSLLSHSIPGSSSDKSDPELTKRWLSVGLTGYFYRMGAVFLAKPPAVAGEPIANLMLSHKDRSAINGALFKLDKRVEKPDKAMNNDVWGKMLWDELDLLTGLKDTKRKSRHNCARSIGLLYIPLLCQTSFR